MPKRKLTEEQVAEIKKKIAQKQWNTAIARDYGVARNTISDIKRGRSWKKVK